MSSSRVFLEKGKGDSTFASMSREVGRFLVKLNKSFGWAISNGGEGGLDRVIILPVVAVE
jgi:hypothetical protein